MSGFLQVVTTVDDEDHAMKIARQLVECRLAACVQVEGPIQSLYWWQGKVENATEWRCSIKTAEERYDELEQKLRALHPYEEPEILAFPVDRGSAGYLSWLSSIVRPTS
ncbi:MAG TPA: divalent-cation tolerance protein CutA [Candidatus Krumholzibacteria bacterium]|nr:divalent-cation tolerance protein CutA [Candidatus Krumholzibacteria bacterium]